MTQPIVLLSFDLEEFDVPDEFGYPIPFEEQVKFSHHGAMRILDVLEKHRVHATFFSTVQFATHAKDVIARLVDGGHELGSHGYYHSQFSEEDLVRSKVALEALAGVDVTGFRMPRMMPVSIKAMAEAGYTYDSSLNPTWVPGRYNHLKEPRGIHRVGSLVEIPASVTPLIRFPLFWISMHALPFKIYERMCRKTLAHDGYLNLYFHPWEFAAIKDPRFPLPWYITKNSGEAFVDRLDRLVQGWKEAGYQFCTTRHLVENSVEPVPAIRRN